MFILVFGLIPLLLCAAASAAAVRSALKQPTPLQIGVTVLVLLLSIASAIQIKQIVFGGAYATYLPVITLGAAVILSLLQVLTVRRR